MTEPSTLFDLGLTLRREHDAERLRHAVRLATRLGFRYFWLPFPDADAPLPADLLQSGGTSRAGLILAGEPESVLRRVAALGAGGLPPGVLLEIDAPAELRERLVQALGGLNQWRERAFVPWHDAQAAGRVILAERAGNRRDVLAALADAAKRRGENGRGQVLSVALPVSIGRTLSEAEARARRDPALSGAAHPGIAGLYGTLEHAQQQALELAQAGAGAIRATVADEQDLADVLAQLRSVAVGPTPLLLSRSRRDE